MHVLGEGLGARAFATVNIPAEGQAHLWGLRRAPIGEVDDSGVLCSQDAGSVGGAVERHLQAAQMPGMRQTRCRGATATLQLERQRAQTAAGVRGMRLALSAVEEEEVLAAHLAPSEPAQSVWHPLASGTHWHPLACLLAMRVRPSCRTCVHGRLRQSRSPPLRLLC